jgi:class 3 adenylate cyclase
VLWFLSTHQTGTERDLETARAFREEDWSYNRRRWAGLVYHDGPVSMQRAFSRAVSVTTSPGMAARRFEEPVDLDALLSQVGQPTLVLQRDVRGPAREFTIRAAGFLPNGQLRFLPGEAATPYPIYEPIVDAAIEFLGIASEDDRATAALSASGTAVILFADVVDSTALAEQLGNAPYRKRTRTLEERVRAAISSNGGAPVEGRTLGDGVLGVFTSASDAIAAALQCALIGEEIGLALHLGLHAGDVLREGSQVHGQAVSVASRVSDLSTPNEVLVSGTVRDLARASAGVSFEDRGDRELKGVSEAVRIYAVRQDEQ